MPRTNYLMFSVIKRNRWSKSFDDYFNLLLFYIKKKTNQFSKFISLDYFLSN